MERHTQLDSESLQKKGPEAFGLLAAIVDSSDDAIISKTLDGIITSWNKGAERMFGHSSEEAVGQSITLIIPLERRSEETEIIARLRRGEKIDHFETVRLHKDGTLLDISVTISPVKDAEGRITGASKVARDIGKRKKAEQETQELDEQLARQTRIFNATLSSITDFVYTFDRNGRFTYINQALLDLWGLKLEEAVGKNFFDLQYPAELASRLQLQIQQVIDSRHPVRDETPYTSPTGAGGYYEYIFSPVFDAHGNVELIAGATRDITERKLVEDQVRQSEERLRELAADLDSQVRERTRELELRNTEITEQATQVRELSQRLLQAQDNERRSIARDLHDSSGQLVVALAINLEMIAQTASGGPVVVKAIQESQELIQQLTRELRTASYLLHPPLLDESGLESALSLYIQGLSDRSGLQIVLNIDDNFGRLSPEIELTIFRIVQECLTNIHRHSGSKTASIRLERDAEAVALEIKDTGQGMSEEKLYGIKHKRRSGVGIAGMRERIERFAGRLDIQSDGGGTRVEVRLPVLVAEEE
ncbi:MAG TPA: PAS domain S-box protein [Terriglobales bacterium]|nr:PAS domain S-box protein [Terriglobales bacterium]